MIDIKVIRENPELVKKNTKNRGYNVDIKDILALDDKWRKLKKDDDDLRAERNKISKQVNELKKSKNESQAKQLIEKAKEIPKKLKKNEEKEKALKEKLDKLIAVIPNLQKDEVPIGDEKKNKEIKKHGKIPKFNFQVRSHSEILEKLGLLDMKRATKISGSGFYMFKGKLAKLERALINFMLDFHIKDGFLEINTAQLVNAKAMYGTGNLPKFEDDAYKTKEGLYLVPTAEVSLTNIYAGEVLKEKDFPKKFVAFTQCYRTEAGQHGSETPGIHRLHQFEKVEMVYICKPEDSDKFLEEMTERAERILEMLEIPYRRVLLATADASFASAKTYDLEVWSPAMKKYLEASSCSNCTDFQTRRMNLRYQSAGNLSYAHTLNGSGLATPRLLISLIENNQQADGSIKIPKVLWKYTGFKEIKAGK